MMAQILIGFSAQEYGTDTKNPTVLNCGSYIYKIHFSVPV